MSRQQMSFQLAYGETERKANCKSCQGTVETGDLIVGVKSDSMYDPMWYHFHCFWTRCWYRKQMSRHLEDYAELTGFSKLAAEDKQRFKDALDDQTGGDTGASSTGLKRRSISEEDLVDVRSKKSKSEVLSLPKLSLSAAGLLSKSSTNLAATEQVNSAKGCSEQAEEIVVSNATVVSVRNTSAGASVTIAMTDGVNSSCTSTFGMTLQQWRKMTSVFSDVTSAMTSMGERGEREFPLLDSQTIRVVHSDGSVYINLCAARETTQNSEGQTKGTTFTPDEWLHLTKRVDDIEAAVLRVAS